MNESGKELLGPRVLVIRIAPNSAYQTKDNQSVRTWASKKISYFKYWSLSDFHGFLFFENKIFTWLGSLIGKKVISYWFLSQFDFWFACESWFAGESWFATNQNKTESKWIKSNLKWFAQVNHKSKKILIRDFFYFWYNSANQNTQIKMNRFGPSPDRDKLQSHAKVPQN